MKVVILAAGRGSRLEELTKDKPKMLLKLDEESILERQLRLLKDSGIKKEDIHIVVGYEGKKIEEKISDKIKIIWNDEFDTKDNIYSLYLGLKEIEDEFVLLNGDVVFPSGFLEGLYSKKNVLVTDSEKNLNEEEMKVELSNNHIKNLSKSMSPDDAHGEYIGIAKFSEEGNRRLQKKLKELLDSGKTQEWYEKAIAEICSEIEISPFNINSSWVEVDDKKDLKTARKLFQNEE